MAHKIYIEKINEVHLRLFSEDSVEQELSDFFTFEVPGARFTPQFRQRLWDGKIRMYDRLRKTLYVGLYDYVEKFCFDREYELEYTTPKKELETDNGITFEEVEEFANWLEPSTRGVPIQIRDYQIAAVHTALNKERCLLLSPTASGKSFIIYTALRYHLLQDRKVMIVVPTTSLVEQFYKDIIDYSSKNHWEAHKHCQRLYSGFPKEFEKDVLITTWQSIYKQPRAWFNQFDVIFGDEAHQFKARSLTSIMEKLPHIRYRIGTTGTLDNKKVHKLVLEGIFGKIHKVTTTKQLMETDRLAKLNITCLLMKYDEITRQGRKNNQYQDEMDFLCTNEKRNNFITNLACKLKGNTLVLFQYVKKHGIPLYELIDKKAGDEKQVFFVSGETIVAHREQIREIATDTDNNIIVASFGTFSTGINIPSIENIIFASPSKSKIRNLQSIGRGLRLKEGKTECNLYDLADDLHWKSWKNHTLNHFSERIRQYSEENFNYKIVEVKLDSTN